MSISRLKAQGQKWYRWYSRTRRISEEKVKKFPRRYRKRRLMTTTATAEYEISEVLVWEYDSVKRDRFVVGYDLKKFRLTNILLETAHDQPAKWLRLTNAILATTRG